MDRMDTIDTMNYRLFSNNMSYVSLYFRAM